MGSSLSIPEETLWTLERYGKHLYYIKEVDSMPRLFKCCDLIVTIPRILDRRYLRLKSTRDFSEKDMIYITAICMKQGVLYIQSYNIINKDPIQVEVQKVREWDDEYNTADLKEPIRGIGNRVLTRKSISNTGVFLVRWYIQHKYLYIERV